MRKLGLRLFVGQRRLSYLRDALATSWEAMSGPFRFDVAIFYKTYDVLASFWLYRHLHFAQGLQMGWTWGSTAVRLVCDVMDATRFCWEPVVESAALTLQFIASSAKPWLNLAMTDIFAPAWAEAVCAVRSWGRSIVEATGAEGAMVSSRRSYTTVAEIVCVHAWCPFASETVEPVEEKIEQRPSLIDQWLQILKEETEAAVGLRKPPASESSEQSTKRQRGHVRRTPEVKAAKDITASGYRNGDGGDVHPVTKPETLNAWWPRLT